MGCEADAGGRRRSGGGMRTDATNAANIGVVGVGSAVPAPRTRAPKALIAGPATSRAAAAQSGVPHSPRRSSGQCGVGAGAPGDVRTIQSASVLIA